MKSRQLKSQYGSWAQNAVVGSHVELAAVDCKGSSQCGSWMPNTAVECPRQQLSSQCSGWVFKWFRGAVSRNPIHSKRLDIIKTKGTVCHPGVRDRCADGGPGVGVGAGAGAWIGIRAGAEDRDRDGLGAGVGGVLVSVSALWVSVLVLWVLWVAIRSSPGSGSRRCPPQQEWKKWLCW